MFIWDLGNRMAFANYPMSLDEADHWLFGVTRFPAQLLIFDTNTGKIVQSLSAAGDCDDVFYDLPVNRFMPVEVKALFEIF
jgi:hypothetical protein